MINKSWTFKTYENCCHAKDDNCCYFVLWYYLDKLWFFKTRFIKPKLSILYLVQNLLWKIEYNFKIMCLICMINSRIASVNLVSDTMEVLQFTIFLINVFCILIILTEASSNKSMLKRHSKIMINSLYRNALP